MDKKVNFLPAWRILVLPLLLLVAVATVNRCDEEKAGQSAAPAGNGELRLEQAEEPIREALPWIRDAKEQWRRRKREGR